MSYYNILPNVQAIDIIKKTLTLDEYRGFLKGNILKYQLRLGKKDEVEKEKEKIRVYSELLAQVTR